ncbi:hypothetical protein D3C81_1485960 [compost metagenome]
MQDNFLGRVERSDHAAILLGQFKAPGFHIQLADGFEQRGLKFQVAPQFTEQPRQALLDWLVGEQRLPQHRQQPVPGCTSDQQQGFVPEVADFAAALVHADHGVDRKNEGGRGDCTVAFTQRTKHGQAKAGQG